jgi:DNA-binding GntR family transcriptional regulator
MAGATSPQGGERAAGSKVNLWESIRDQLIDDIESGRIPAGALLPSMRELTAKLTISTTTARRALAEVVASGYARSEGTRGNVSNGPQALWADSAPEVKTTHAAPSTVSAGTLRVRPPQAVGLSDEAGAESGSVDVRTETAPAEIALALRLPDPAAPVLVRRQLEVDRHGTPLRFQARYIAEGHAEGTPLAAPEPLELPWADAIAQLANVPNWKADAYVTARHPSDSEAAMLGLSPTACVLVKVELLVDKTRNPLAYAVSVWPAEGTRLVIREG